MTKPTMTNATIFGAALMIGGLALGGAAGPAFAHTPEVVATCDSLAVNLAKYETIAAQPAAGGNPAIDADDAPNTVSITVDGAVVVTQAFGATYAVTLPLDSKLGHSYSVIIDAVGTEFDRPSPGQTAPFSGVTVACVTTTTPPQTPTPPTVTPPQTPTDSGVGGVSTAPKPTPPVPPVPTATGGKQLASTGAKELASTGASEWTAPMLGAGLMMVVAGSGVLLARVRRSA